MAPSTTSPESPTRVVPELPPVAPVSKRAEKVLPNWALKTIMALTGTIGALFLAFHLFGNLKVYTGAEHFNEYAHWLRYGILTPLIPALGVVWVLRVVLAGCILLHVSAAFILWRRGRVARGKFKAKRNNGFRSFSATLMPITGILICLFVIFHLADLTLGIAPAAPEGFQEGTDSTSFAYQNLIASFSRPLAACFYVVTMLLLSLHIGHGLYTVASDLGATGKRLRAVLVFLAGAIAIFVLLGNASIPLAVLLGVIA